MVDLELFLQRELLFTQPRAAADGYPLRVHIFPRLKQFWRFSAALPVAAAELRLVRSYECVFNVLRYASNDDHWQNDV